MAGRTRLIGPQEYGIAIKFFSHDMQGGKGPIRSVSIINQSSGSNAYVFADTDANATPIATCGPDSVLTFPIDRQSLAVVVTPNVPGAAGDGFVTVHIDEQPLSASAGYMNPNPGGASGSATRSGLYKIYKY